ncbi:protoheme IX farnesyltransferase [Marinobacter halodurans]|uniref:Protoheme IX farnesyltransferase n=1 Tax=Marinobacter halodurans TaxID=2528979 RepID=A0ABY1ZGQ2_9GAMM|nr:protoheme IX farnesyltransferase [Marinobacter halodurans]
MLGQFIALTKPGIIFGNSISVMGGFFLAAQGEFSPGLFIVTLVGLALVIASGCAFNNLIDRDIDAVMERTRNRPLVQGTITPATTLGFATLLGLAGFTMLLATNVLTAGLAVFGFAIYVGAYSLYSKRHSVYGTLIGSLSGAVPPVVGYCAVTGQFDTGAAIILVTFCLWQMPHSYAIAIFRFRDYQMAGIPVLPVVKGIRTAKFHIVGYTIAFMLAALSLSLAGYTGIAYFVVMLLMGLYWLKLGLAGFRTEDNVKWAKGNFGFSILTVCVLSLMMGINGVLPAFLA